MNPGPVRRSVYCVLVHMPVYSSSSHMPMQELRKSLEALSYGCGKEEGMTKEEGGLGRRSTSEAAAHSAHRYVSDLALPVRTAPLVSRRSGPGAFAATGTARARPALARAHTHPSVDRASSDGQSAQGQQAQPVESVLHELEYRPDSSRHMRPGGASHAPPVGGALAGVRGPGQRMSLARKGPSVRGAEPKSLEALRSLALNFQNPPMPLGWLQE
jgi:hypothetical protein